MNSGTIAGENRPAETELLFDVPQDDGAAQDEGAAAELPGVGFGDFVRMILVLGFVIALIYGFVWMLRKFSAQKGESEEIINLLSTRPLKGDAALHLVEVGARVFLVGSCGSSVNLVSEIDDEESIDELRMAAAAAPAPITGGFARMFRDRFGAGPAAGGRSGESGSGQAQTEEEPQNDDPASFLRSQKERLKDL